MDATTQRAGAIAIALGGVLFIVGMLVHPPEALTADENFATVAAQASAWRLAHWILAVSVLSLGAGALVLARSSVGVRALAWSVVALSAVPLAVALAIETTVAPDLAVAGDRVGFRAFESLATGLFDAEAPLLIGLLAIAIAELRAPSAPTLPRWAHAIGAMALVVTFVSWVGAVLLNATIASLGIVGLLAFAYVIALGVRWAMPTRGSMERGGDETSMRSA